MLLTFCLATAKKLGPQGSVSLDIKGLHSKMEYRKKAIFPKYSVKIVQLPHHAAHQDLGAIPLAYESEKDLGVAYQLIFDSSYAGDINDPGYRKFKEEIRCLVDLIQDKKYDKSGNYSAAYKNGKKDAELTEIESKFIYDAMGEKPKQVGQLSLHEDVIYAIGPEGLTLRSRVLDEAVFESGDKIKIVVGPRQNHDHAFENFRVAKTVDDLNLSGNFLTRAGIVGQMAGNEKEIEIIVVGAPGITEADVRKKVDTILQGTDYKTEVESSRPKELNVALMGGLSTSTAYHYFTPKFIFTVRAGLDYIFGKFCQTASLRTNAEINPKLGIGAFLGAGIDYRCTNNMAVGLKGGVRLNELTTTKISNPGQRSSTWFYTPYAQINGTFFTEDDSAIGVFLGYLFPREFSIKSTGTSIPFGSSCKISGVYSGVRFSRYF